ncbi:MAG TPA: hypothetical protein VJP02_13995 [Candidatus Sulfotelmatobacter sp.]|nr:hypothetical protein [Candidatus Sulfotelmatobacter sp.]
MIPPAGYQYLVHDAVAIFKGAGGSSFIGLLFLEEVFGDVLERHLSFEVRFV